jgi:hypothetical protein
MVSVPLPRYPAERPFDCLNGSNFMQPLCCQSYVFGEHHECAATCLDLLSDCAGTVNSLGEVQWCSVETILRSNYLSRQENPYPCRVELRVREGVPSMMIIGPHCVDLQKKLRQVQQNRSWGSG